ncbi:hypothetical protein F8M41_025776 [Gigaspora margarita]|uniref:Uncharacterized protein n=1 Tax=Gigaspora margarita TaxID=4874 RepID=A0A8H3XIN5_GIGMA|nr:hypothetical protein F8M41_025776 [Gigaspora margarita]
MQANNENCAESPPENRLNPDDRSSEAAKTRLIDKDDKAPKKLFGKFTCSQVFGILGICLVILLIITLKMRFGQEISPNKDRIFQSIINLADYGSEKLSSLEIPETSEMSGYRAIVRDLGVIMERSDIIVKNGKKISEVLFELDKEIQKAGDELEEFRHQAKSFYFSIASEMNSITQEIEKSQWLEYGFFKYFINSNSHLLPNSAEFIHKRLKVLEKQIPGFQEQLKRVITTIYSVHNSADNTQGYLIDGEREAERVLKEHWLEYRRNIQDVAKEVKNTPTKPTTEDMKYLKKAVANLEEQHAQFLSAKKQFISMDTYNDEYLEEKTNS